MKVYSFIQDDLDATQPPHRLSRVETKMESIPSSPRKPLRPVVTEGPSPSFDKKPTRPSPPIQSPTTTLRQAWTLRQNHESSFSQKPLIDSSHVF